MTHKSVLGPSGQAITIADLPPSKTKRWVIKRKAAVVLAVEGGLLTKQEALSRYNLSEAEWQRWQQVYRQHGVAGLRITRAQEYR